jgi:hypothetical protein
MPMVLPPSPHSPAEKSIPLYTDNIHSTWSGTLSLNDVALLLFCSLFLIWSTKVVLMGHQ